MASVSEEAERLRLEFVARFPIDAWATMPVEEYALGRDVEGGSACWWLEFKTRLVGSMSGGSSAKHLIWYSSDGLWRFPKKYGSIDEAWTAVRGGFVEMLTLASQGRFDEIDAIEALHGGRALRTKTLHMYFPNEILPVSSKKHLEAFLAAVGDSSDDLGAVQANRRLLQSLRAEPQLHDLTTQDLGQFVYHWADPRPSFRIRKIAPGEQGRLWPECLAGGFICVAWDDVGDLSEYESKDAFRAAFEQHYPYGGNQAQITRKSNELWTLMELEPGDKVIANRGVSEVLAIGTVNDSGYEYRADRAEYRHTVGVDWDTSYARQIEPVRAWGTTTVAKVSAVQYRALVDAEATTTVVEIDDRFGEVEAALARRGQVVFYGPPGTGKTYSARRAAVWLLLGGTADADAASTLADAAEFARLEGALSTAITPVAKAARLTRLTFHPSYAYEDFVEGFRPVPAVGGGVELALVDGVFKRVCIAAASDPTQRYVLLIDEINRGNIPKIFGELITLIERDKRSLTVVLPQSGQDFAVPPNLLIIGTMNTADRSVHLLDTALRRRFAFIELMPDSAALAGAVAGGLALDVFLDNLNDEVRRRVGREKQIGHAMFFDGDQPIASSDAFSAIFRHELLPLLQEYLYEDYSLLGDLLGGELIDGTREQPTALIDDPDALCAALADRFGAHASI